MPCCPACPFGIKGNKCVAAVCVALAISAPLTSNMLELPVHEFLIPAHRVTWSLVTGSSLWVLGPELFAYAKLLGGSKRAEVTATQRYHHLTWVSFSSAAFYFTTFALGKALDTTGSKPKMSKRFLSSCALLALGANLVNLLFVYPKANAEVGILLDKEIEKYGAEAVTSCCGPEKERVRGLAREDAQLAPLHTSAVRWSRGSLFLSSVSTFALAPFLCAYLPNL